MDMKLIWDVPTRLFHWLLVFSLIGQYVTAELLDNAMQWHFYLGYFTLGLIIFRILWGVVGTDYAKFSHFIYGPVAVFKYSRTILDPNSTPHAGHNPLGGWVVIVMLALVATQAVSGLFMTDDIFLDGPWYAAVSSDTQDLMNLLHHQTFNFLLLVILMHVLAIGFYALFKKQRLAPAMIHGKKATQQRGIRSSKLVIAIICALLSAGVVYYVVEIAPPEIDADVFY